MPEPAELDDYRWLIGTAGRAWLSKLAQGGREFSVARVAALRRELSAFRASLLVEQSDLRWRARERFPAAEKMFFTRRSLEQATDIYVAAVKAARYHPGGSTVDFCCGIGGDFLALAQGCPTRGIDRDPLMALLAEANREALAITGSSIQVAEADPETLADPVTLSEAEQWHIDPDRRPDGRRTTRVDLHEPGPALIDALRNRVAAGGVKLAPAATLPDAWREAGELEWISRQGECRQLVVWFGGLARTPGMRRATVISSMRPGAAGTATEECIATVFNPPIVSNVTGRGGTLVPIARIGRYLYEPDAAVLAAGLTGELAERCGLWGIAAGIGYLSSDRLVSDGVMSGFEVDAVLPMSIRHVKAWLRERRIGKLEVKKRGVSIDPQRLRHELATAGDRSATLLVTRADQRTIAVLASRIGDDQRISKTGP